MSLVCVPPAAFAAILFIYYHIVAPHEAAFRIANVIQALVERTQTTLRHVIGAPILLDAIERRGEVAQSIREIIEDIAVDWGVQVESMLFKDIIFSKELQESLSMAVRESVLESPRSLPLEQRYVPCSEPVPKVNTNNTRLNLPS